ncbi:hypothetical protein H9657_09180 [Cellulomonas sp. Sa3CUA2]|uniref:Uncharacterized protein n=1 Tax=Cellulomonas avistercoris TaxID=2762242 RepID=A0ABR8QDF2_9CELL|nr:hypothetical protein [Cellulomonas avistercoris]MBD7918448.1 hypothetical protein [Cellulomonas avistercoris]
MRRSPALPALAATAVALVLAGCTGGTSAASADDDGPMTAFFEKVGGSYEDEDFEKQQREVEELVATCMAEQGFEYSPNDPSSSRGMDPDDIPEWDSKEYALQFGYGATTSDELYGGSEEWVDPNADYIASMSEGEQTAFYEALWGASPEVDPEADPDAEVEYNWEDGGCQGKASHEVYEQDQIWDDPAFEAMSEEMNSEYETLADDPALGEAQAEWAACITKAGYDYASPDEAQQSIFDELNALYEAAAPDPEAEPDPEASYEPDEAAMAELKKKEMALAAADYECKESSGYIKAQKTASRALEDRLWEKYGEQLEAIAAKRTPAK